MRINFFEEFPIKRNLERAKLINFPSTVFLAAKSLTEFNKSKKELFRINSRIETGYWPIIKKSYWISPFSPPSELIRILKEVPAIKGKMLLDLEVPILNKRLFLQNMFFFARNKKIIEQIFKQAEKVDLEIYTAEYAPPNKLFKTLAGWLGISYPLEKFAHQKIVMLYSSVAKNQWYFRLRKEFLIQEFKKYGDRIEAAVGAIGTGIGGNEPLLTPLRLKEEIASLNENGFKTATIFRLGGLNEKYLEIIKNFVT